MPNWVRNHVEFGTDKVLKDCIDEKGKFDFNKILPMPKVLEEDGGFDKMTQEERLLFLKENDDCNDWYSWHTHFWGTKWNADETQVIDDYTVEFDTAWNMPDGIFKAISKKYSTFINVKYADEDLGSNCGTCTYENGEETSWEDGDRDFAEKIWGWGEQEEEGGDMG